MLPASLRLSRHAPHVALIVAAMCLGYGLRSFADAFPLVRHSSKADVVRDGRGFGPALQEAASGRVPGEFEKKDALLLGVNELLEYHPETLVEIIRVPHPAARDDVWRSYTIVIYGNDMMLVPQFPGRRVVGIDSSKIVAKRGGLHCLALSIPSMPDPHEETRCVSPASLRQAGIADRAGTPHAGLALRSRGRYALRGVISPTVRSSR